MLTKDVANKSFVLNEFRMGMNIILNQVRINSRIVAFLNNAIEVGSIKQDETS